MNVEFDNFIATFDDAFDETWIEQLCKYYHTYNDLGAFQGKYLPKHLRDDEQLYFLDPARIHDVHPHYAQYFFEVLKKQIIPVYMDKFSILQEREYATKQLKMKRIQEGGGYHQWHYESTGGEITRKVVVQLYLNTITEGGETEFLYQKKRINARKNRLIMWPADWTYTHRGNTPLKDDKYILTTWLEEVTK
tara:strand:- start:298 stop:873 length:576 start_codon:yes stop_codon:yes gene_type:complete